MGDLNNDEIIFPPEEKIHSKIRSNSENFLTPNQRKTAGINI